MRLALAGKTKLWVWNALPEHSSHFAEFWSETENTLGALRPLADEILQEIRGPLRVADQGPGDELP